MQGAELDHRIRSSFSTLSTTHQKRAKRHPCTPPPPLSPQQTPHKSAVLTSTGPVELNLDQHQVYPPASRPELAAQLGTFLRTKAGASTVDRHLARLPAHLLPAAQGLLLAPPTPKGPLHALGGQEHDLHLSVDADGKPERLPLHPQEAFCSLLFVQAHNFCVVCTTKPFREVGQAACAAPRLTRRCPLTRGACEVPLSSAVSPIVTVPLSSRPPSFYWLQPTTFGKVEAPSVACAAKTMSESSKSRGATSSTRALARTKRACGPRQTSWRCEASLRATFCATEGPHSPPRTCRLRTSLRWLSTLAMLVGFARLQPHMFSLLTWNSVVKCMEGRAVRKLFLWTLTKALVGGPVVDGQEPSPWWCQGVGTQFL